MKTSPVENSTSRSPLRRRSFSEGGSLSITSHYPATPKLSEGGSLLCHAKALAKAGHCSLVTIILAFCCFALAPSPKAFGVSPPPDGGYAGANTAEGTNALLNLTTGIANTAMGSSALLHDTTGGWNVGIGSGTLAANTSGSFNMAIGTDALSMNTASSNLAIGFRTLFFNTTGHNLTGVGANALYNNSTASFNTAVGGAALYKNTTGFDNTANGYQALYSNVSGQDNTANGFKALDNNDGDQNTATGSQALYRNTDGSDNTAIGFKALYNDQGDQNTAIGSEALFSNTSGGANTATGFQALFSNTMGNSNTANGFAALFSNTMGDSNNAIGYAALTSNTTGIQNNAFGYSALLLNVTGNNNTAIGDTAGAMITGSGNVCIGEGVQGVAAVDNTTWIRNVYDSVASDRAVYVNSDNKIGTLASSRRYKEEIKPMEKASEALLALKPVTFRYKQGLDPHHVPMFGLIAEEVEKVNPDLVTRNKKGETETVRYDAINAMLLNEFLKEHKKVQDLEATVAQQQKGMDVLTAQLKEQAAQIQKVSAQLEVSKPAPQTVANK